MTYKALRGFCFKGVRYGQRGQDGDQRPSSRKCFYQGQRLSIELPNQVPTLRVLILGRVIEAIKSAYYGQIWLAAVKGRLSLSRRTKLIQNPGRWTLVSPERQPPKGRKTLTEKPTTLPGLWLDWGLITHSYKTNLMEVEDILKKKSKLQWRGWKGNWKVYDAFWREPTGSPVATSDVKGHHNGRELEHICTMYATRV